MLKIIGKLLSSLARIETNSMPVSTNASVSLAQTNFNNNIELQIQDINGNWRTCHVTQNIPAMIIAGMRQLEYQFPGHRVRAVDSNWRVVDIL